MSVKRESSDSPGVQTKDKRLACVECRQQKVKCDGQEGSDCSRCKRKGIPCVVQKGFKRTYKRAQLASLEGEMERLKRVLDEQERAKTAASAHQSASSLLDLSNSAIHYAVPVGVEDGEQQLSSRIGSADTRLGNENTALGNADTQLGHHQEPNIETRNLPSPKFKPASLPDIEPRETPETAPIPSCVKPKTIHEVTLSVQTVNALFKEFVDHYHPILPIVNLQGGPEHIYRQCPSLFWTIMLVASRRYAEDDTLLLRLTEPVKACLAEVTISPITRYVASNSQVPILNIASVHSVQAFLVYTMWPPVTSSLSADSSWNTCGVALFSAIKIGLHCPGYARDFSRIKTASSNSLYPQISEQIRTWIACNIVSQTVATVMGFPAFANFDSSILSACSSDSSVVNVPESLKQMCLLSQLDQQIEKTLNSNSKDPLGLCQSTERLSLISIISRRLDRVETEAKEYDPLRRFLFLSVRVRLYIYYYLDNMDFSDIQLQKGLVQLYNASLEFLDHVTSVHARDPSFIKYLPGVYTQQIWQTLCVIIKIIHSSLNEFIDTSSGKKLFDECLKLLENASILKHDMAYRASEITYQLWHLYATLHKSGRTSTKVNIRTRLSASVFFDCLWTMREECGIRSMAPSVLTQVYRQGNQPAGVKQLFTNIPLDPKPRLATELPIHHPQGSSTYPIHPASASSGVESDGDHSQSSAVSGTRTPHLSSSPSENRAKRIRLNSGSSDGKEGRKIVSEQLNDNSAWFDTQGMDNWDLDSIFKDVDSIMNDFGFRADEAGVAVNE
ncbi:Regulatory protein [Yarrowia sp. C11]|nr:Regulatory protein [Yarrowia sp. E02]KAG5369574.1 Regulatory protein [Yarrowia sp. C11]